MRSIFAAVTIAGALLFVVDAKAASSKALVQTLDARQAEEGDRVVCPIMKEKFTVGLKTLYVEYKGKKYYVDSIMCQALLRKYPEEFLSPEKISEKAPEKVLKRDSRRK
jgi:hypothetical protein